MASGAKRPRGFGKALRIRARGEFQSIQRRGRRRHSPHFIVISTERTSGATARLGVTVSRSVGNSVVRSRVKRRIREVFRLVRERLSPHADLVVIAKAGAGDLSGRATADELHAALGL